MPRDVAVIVVAAGQGQRFGNGLGPKQYLPIGGVPMVLRALRPFTSHPDIAQAVLVLPASDVADPPAFLRHPLSLDQPGSSAAPSALTIVPGGAHRSESVRSGIAALRKECTIVLVHDGARPFVERGVIDEVIGHARRGEGAIAAVPLGDTLKQASSDDPTRIERTIPRERLWRAQTPQGFPRSVLEKAYAGGLAEATDDATLVEALGVPVRLVPDSTRNLKITTRADLALAERLVGESR